MSKLRRKSFMENKTVHDCPEEGQLTIQPDTTIEELLQVYPQLEALLVELAPDLAKLKNPVLRKAIGKVTTMQKVAELGQQSIGTVINRLRREVGQAERFESAEGDKPEWLRKGKIVRVLDARPMLEKGKHPVETVMQELPRLKNGQVYQLITSFYPGPLVEMAKSRGFRAWGREEEPNLFYNYFTVAE